MAFCNLKKYPLFKTFPRLVQLPFNFKSFAAFWNRLLHSCVLFNPTISHSWVISDFSLNEGTCRLLLVFIFGSLTSLALFCKFCGSRYCREVLRGEVTESEVNIFIQHPASISVPCFIVVSLIVFMSLYEFCDFFLLNMYVQLFIKSVFPDAHCFCAVLHEIYFISSAFFFFFFPVSWLSSSHSTSSYLLSAWLVSHHVSIISTKFPLIFLLSSDSLLRILLSSSRRGHSRCEDCYDSFYVWSYAASKLE